METIQPMKNQLSELAQHLFVRREAILSEWRRRVGGDNRLTTASTLPRTQLNDHITQLLAGNPLRIGLTRNIAAKGRFSARPLPSEKFPNNIARSLCVCVCV